MDSFKAGPSGLADRSQIFASYPPRSSDKHSRVRRRGYHISQSTAYLTSDWMERAIGKLLITFPPKNTAGLFNVSLSLSLSLSLCLPATISGSHAVKALPWFKLRRVYTSGGGRRFGEKTRVGAICKCRWPCVRSVPGTPEAKRVNLICHAASPV